MVRLLSVLLSLIFFAPHAHAEVLFEGYSKVLSGDKQIGYVVTRYEYDAKKKQFISAYFLKTTMGGTDITESLKAFADSELAPISYEYTNVTGKDTKTIDAKFKKENMSASIRTGNKVQKIDKKIPKGTFLSSFLVYLMLKSKDGLKSETNYEYQAIAEEDATIAKGQALVGKEEMHNGVKAFKILNTFKDLKFLSYVNDRGEVLGTNALGQGITTELVASPADATKGFPVSNLLLKAIFGTTPEGKENILARAAKLQENEKKDLGTRNKGNMVPAGQGIMVKPSSEQGTKGK
jgi:hypothetical protein